MNLKNEKQMANAVGAICGRPNFVGKTEKGITLIALVITIIVLLILAGVTINFVLDDKGIMTQAQVAKGKNKLAAIKEIKTLWETEGKLDKENARGLDELVDELKQQNIINDEEAEEIKKTGRLTIGGEDIIFKEDIWDGVSIDISWYNDTDIEFEISTAAELAGLAQLVNNGNYFTGKTIYIKNYINLNNKEWTPIGATSYFSGNFYGENNIISNIKEVDKSVAGLFGLVYNAKIKDIAMENISITGNGSYCGGIAGYVIGDTTFENIKIKGLEIDTLYTAGGIVGNLSGTTIIQDIEIIGDVKINGPYYLGGVAGNITGGNTIKNVNIIVNEGSYIKGTSTDAINIVGGIAGLCTGTVVEPNINFATIDNCYSNIDIIISSVGAGGIVGFTDASKIKNCTAEAEIVLESTVNDESYLTIGGISGYTCHSEDVNNVTIENCNVNGSLKYIVNGNVNNSVQFSNSGIAGCDRIEQSQNLTIINCYFNENKVET